MKPAKLHVVKDDEPYDGRCPAGRSAALQAETVPVSVLRTAAAIASGATIRPVFTHRTHYGAPKPFGHRTFILGKQEWR